MIWKPSKVYQFQHRKRKLSLKGLLKMDEELSKKIEDCPIGATHYTALFDGSNITFWKKAISDYGVELGEPFRDWFSWAGDVCSKINTI